jgi:hypothetical protein
MTILAPNAGDFRFAALGRARVLVFMPREALDKRHGRQSRRPGPQS